MPSTVSRPKPLKRHRKQLSCDPCRIAKFRCNRAEPVCSKCTSRGLGNQHCTRKGWSGTPKQGQGSTVAPPPAARPTHGNIGNRVRRIEEEEVALPVASGGATTDSVSRLASIRTRTHSAEALEDLSWQETCTKAKALLPKNLVQMTAVVTAYRDQIAVTKPWYNSSKMLRRVQQLYQTDNNLDLLTKLSLYSWLCSVTSAVYDLVPPTRLIIWGLLFDVDLIDQLAGTYSQLGIDCFKSARQELEEESNTSGDGDATLLLIQAGLTCATQPSARVPSIPCLDILDCCLRWARRTGLDRLGPYSQREKNSQTLEEVATWSGLVYVDWLTAPYQGSYSIYPATFTTEWDVTLDDVDALSDKGEGTCTTTSFQEWIDDARRMCIWPFAIKVAAATRELCDMGIYEATRRRKLSYTQVLSHDAFIQNELDLRPDEFKMIQNGAGEERQSATKAKRRQESWPWLHLQANNFILGLQSNLLALHMPFLLQGYNNNDSPNSYSVQRAREQSVQTIQTIQTMASNDFVLHKTILSRHALFKAGLVLISDLLMHRGEPHTSALSSLSSQEENSLLEDGLEKQLSFVFDRLAVTDRNRNKQPLQDLESLPPKTTGTLSSNAGGNPGVATKTMAPYGLDLSGKRLEALLIRVIRRNIDSNQGSVDGTTAVREYMQRYATDFNGHVYRGANAESIQPIQHEQIQTFESNSDSFTHNSVQSTTSEELLNSMLVFAETGAGLPIDAQFCNSFFAALAE